MIVAPDPAKLIGDGLAAYAVPHPDPREWYDRGEWKIARDTWSVAYAQGGPASASAVLYRYGEPVGTLCHYKMAVATIDFALNRYLRSDGNFGGLLGEPSLGISTMMFANELGIAILALEGRLDGPRHDWYVWALTQMADVIVMHAKWWSNGNINAGYLSVLYLAWRITRLERFKTAYAAQVPFLLQRLKITKEPTKVDSSDGAGYLTENGGYDPEYTQVALDVLTRLLVLSGSPVILRLCTLLTNKLLGSLKTDVATYGPYQIDKTGGSRHPTGTVAMTTAALDVLSRRGGKFPSVDQWGVIDSTFRKTFKYAAGENWLKALGVQPGTMLLDRIKLPVVLP